MTKWIFLIASSAVLLSAVTISRNRAGGAEPPAKSAVARQEPERIDRPVRALRTPAENSARSDAMADASALEVLRIARIAARQGRAITRDAMVSGLKKDPERAKRLIAREIASADPQDAQNLKSILGEMP